MTSTVDARAARGSHVVVAGLIAVIVLLPVISSTTTFGLGLLPNRWITVGVLGATYATLALGLVVVTGWCGQFILGYAGFFAIGAYAYGILNSQAYGLHLGILLSLPPIVAIELAVALLLGLVTHRVRGDYFALITLAFGEMVRISITNLRDLTGGSAGLVGIDPLTLLPGSGEPLVTSTLGRYVVGWSVVGLLALWIAMVRPTSMGRAWVAIREDEEAARSIGIRSTGVKLTALAMAATMAGLAGCLFAASQLSLVPSSFDVTSSFIVVTALVVGGMGSVPGAVLGTVLLLAIPEIIRDAAGGGAFLLDYQMLIYGGAMLAIILSRRSGLLREMPHDLRLADAPPASAAPMVLPKGGARLELQRLTVRYGGVVALDKLQLDVLPGQVLGIIGPNGSGKTTLLNVISGFHPVASGSIKLDNVAIGTWKPDRRARAGIARTFQMNRLFGGISNAENLITACDTVDAPPSLRDLLGGFGRDRRARTRAAACFAQFPDRFPRIRWPQFPTSLSYANRRRLEMLRAVGIGPRLLLLDEPTAGMNPVDRRQLLHRIRQWADAGTTVIIVEHQLGALAEVADRLVALDHGVVIADGLPAQVLASDDIISRLINIDYHRDRASDR